MTAIPTDDPECGVLLVDKPPGPTSFAMVRRVRRLLGIKKVGHAGTLDPFASGLLIVCVGRPATRLIEQFMGGTKRYEATLQLGVETETMDTEGRVIAITPVGDLDHATLDSCLGGFVGQLLQEPPMYSALKHKGKPLYHYARQGITLPREARPVEIYSLARSWYDPVLQQLGIAVDCSRGTYVRTLASDIGKSLGCGAHLVGLRRLASGCFTVADALDGEALLTATEGRQVREALLPIGTVLARLQGASSM